MKALAADFNCEPGESTYYLGNPEDRAVVLAALYNGVHYQHRHFSGSYAHVMTVDEARELLKTQSRFDYLNGRPMKVDLPEGVHVVKLELYNRDNGCGRGPKVIREVLPETPRMAAEWKLRARGEF